MFTISSVHIKHISIVSFITHLYEMYALSSFSVVTTRMFECVFVWTPISIINNECVYDQDTPGCLSVCVCVCVCVDAHINHIPNT